MAEFEISEAEIPAEALTALSAASAPANEVEVDPVDTLDSGGLFELSNQKLFNPIEYAQANPDKSTNPDVVKKLADVHARVREQGFRLKDLPSPKQAVKGVGHMIVGAAKQGWNYLNAFVGVPLADLAGDITGQNPDFSQELQLENQRRIIETAAGTEAAVTGLSQLPGKAAEKLMHRAGTLTGLAKRYDQQTDEEKAKSFFDDLGKAQVAGEISQGRGSFTGAISSETQKELAAEGRAVRPEEVETLAAGDPLSFILFGKAFGAAGGAVGKVIPKSTGALIEKAGAATAAVGGRTIQSAGKLTEFGGAATKVTGKVLPIVGAVKGTTMAGPAGTIGGLAAGSVAGRAVERIGRGITGAGEGVSSFGQQVATGAGVTPYSQLARDILAASPIVASETFKGAAFDVALAAATSESPQETESAAAFGTVLGGLKGVGRGAIKVAQGQILSPRAWGSPQDTPSYGSFASLDTAHATAKTVSSPGQILRANSIREFLKSTGGKVEAYLMPDAATTERVVTEILQRQGTPAERIPELAKSAAESQGTYVNEVRDDAGNLRRIVLLNEADSAPHESFHGIQDVLGESANQVIDGLVFQEYAPQWENLGQTYSKRLGGAEGNWRETVLDKSGWGNSAAAEKAVRDAGNKLRSETGAEPRAEDVRALAESVLTQAREVGAGWREILSPDEVISESNRYLARELAAENFDAAFKQLSGGKLTEGKSLPEKLARIIANTAAFFGAEPAAGMRTENLGIEPRQAIGKAATDIARSLQVEPKQRPTIEPARTTERSSSAPVTPAERQSEGTRVNGLADELSARNPATAEVLRKIANSISSGTGLKVEYRSAPGEPAGNPGMSREQRRAVIEAFRDMPESVRPLWEKLNFPDRVIPTKNKGFQVLGWSPENYAANAHKVANFIANLDSKVPGSASRLSPYEIDAATKTFTPDAWQRLFDDTTVFVRNQAAGGTGSGRPLQLPENAAQLGVAIPVLKEGNLTALPQPVADFHNLLFNVMLPETVRVSRKGGTPGNIVAQEIARANEPLVGPRVSEPGRPRGVNRTTGEIQEFAGFPGRRIQEVNPLRGELERAAQQSGIEYPSLIETNQRLNIDHIADVTPVPEAQAIRGVTDTLRAGFAPKEFEGTAREVTDKIMSLPPGEFGEVLRDFKGRWGGGQTGLSVELGAKVSAAADLAVYAEAMRSIDGKIVEARAKKDIDTLFSLPIKKQFFRELLEAATDGTTAEFVRKHYDPAFQAPFPKAQYAPRTEAGKAFEKQGYEFQMSGSIGYRKMSVLKKGVEIGELVAHSPKGNLNESWIDNAYLAKPERGKGLGEAAYREMLSQLQTDGVKSVGGQVVSPQPLALRDKIFGEGSTEILVNDERTPINQAFKAIENLRTKPGDFSFVEARNEITPGAQFAPKRNQEVRTVAEDYAKSVGIKLPKTEPVYRNVNPGLAKRLADFYEKSESKPGNPDVQKSYAALASETLDQYRSMVDAGYSIEPWEGKGEPYKSSAEAIKDIAENKHLYFLKTKGNADIHSNNPLLNDSGVVINKERLMVNDVFRAVHDFFGHAKEGYEFGPRGEFNAWAAHSEMYSLEAQGALAAETLAQNSWVNFGKHLRDEAGNIPAKGQPGYKLPTERPFAEQKNVVVPGELIAEAKAQFAPKKPKDEAKIIPAGRDGISKSWILPSGKIEQLGSTWHHEWLDGNKELQKKHGLEIPSFDGGDAEGVREQALRKGFARVNYSRNTGTLTVEARAKDWRKLKLSVEKLVESNLDDIDNMTVHLLDESVNKVVDSQSERLFNFDDAEKLQNIPFITKGEPRAQFAPKVEESTGPLDITSKTLENELSKIRSGTIGGQTFNSDGTIWQPELDSRPVDVVTLASVNLPIGSVKPDTVLKALGPYEELLSEPGIKMGVFAFSKDGKPTVSIDINAIVPQKHRENSVKFARDNDQVAIWDAAKSEEVRTGGKGSTKLKSVDEILSAIDDLKSGKPVDVENILSQSEISPVSEAQELPGLGTGREFNQAAITQMTRAELSEHFPEAVIPRKSTDTISSDITNSPLAKAAGSRESAVNSFARKLVEFYRENEDSPELIAGSKWYSEFTPMLKKEFGADARIFAELLAATSPNSDPASNFGFAFDAYSNFKSGKYDKLVTKFNEGLNKLSDGSLKSVYDRDLKAGKISNAPENASEATYLAWWIEKNKLLPLGTGEKRFGMHSTPVLKVLARKWLELNTGPKTDNFVKNLLGEGDDATIDVWADRTMRRIGYSGSKQRWRVLPRNKTGVTDTDFAFSQEAFREAASELGITASALQGALWFAEKKLWADSGWGRLDLGDFRKEMSKLPLLRSGFEQRQSVKKAATKKPAAKQEEFNIVEPKQLKQRRR